MPAVTLSIIGQNPVQEIVDLAKDQSVNVTGFVSDIRPHISRATVCIAPLISGTGIKYKILEPMAMGKAVIATSWGIRGVKANSGEDVIVADSAQEFANCSVELVNDESLRNLLGRNARNLVERFYSWEYVTQQVDALFLQVLDRAPKAI